MKGPSGRIATKWKSPRASGGLVLLSAKIIRGIRGGLPKVQERYRDTNGPEVWGEMTALEYAQFLKNDGEYSARSGTSDSPFAEEHRPDLPDHC